jgi:hypothetical protein
MCRTAKWLAWTALTSWAVIGSATPRAYGQVITSNPYVRYAPVIGPGYWGYGDPYGGYLHGVADVIRSQGQFMIDRQQSLLMREQVRTAKIETRRKELEQWLWERQNMPTTEDERERSQRQQLRRSRNDPPLNEIWSAKALNDLLEDAKKIQSEGAIGVSAPLRGELLAKINVTSGKAGANIGLLKEGRLSWPLMLRRKPFAQQRERLNQLVTQALDQAGRGQVEAETLDEMIRGVAALQRQLVGQLKATHEEGIWSPTIYIDAKNFLGQFDDALRALQQPDAANYLTGKYAARGKNVGELVKYMTENGLQFAPATPGNETAYTALHRALAGYDSQMGTQLTTPAK